jgi:hypothetical protein
MNGGEDDELGLGFKRLVAIYGSLAVVSGQSW